MPGIKKFRKIQIGKETTKGTTVAATKIWRGTGTPKDDLEVSFPEEDVGILPGTTRSYIAKLASSLALDDTPLTYEQGPILCALGIDDLDTGVADGAGSGKIYDYIAGISTDPGFFTGTVEGGDDQQEEEMEYSFASEITFKGAAAEAWMMGGTLVGRQMVPSTFTAALAVPAVEDALFSKTKLYIDTGGGTIGTTLKSNTLLDAEVRITTGLVAKFTADGQLYFSFAKRVMPEIVLTITFEHDGVAVAEKAAWRAQTVRLIQLLNEGSTLGMAGAYTLKTFRLRMAGKWETFDAIDESDGNDIVRGTFQVRYSSADALFFQALFVNELAGLFT